MNTKKLTRKHIVNIIVCSIILLGLIVAFICYVHEPNLTRDTDRKPDITFNGKTFDISAKDFVRVVNEDLAKEGLSLISTDYAKDASEISMLNGENKQLDFAYEEYTCPIDKNLTLHLFVFPELDDGIASIQLQSRGTPSLTTEENTKGDAYYKVICDNIDPRFDVENFDTHADNNTHYKLDELIFYCTFYRENTDDDPNESADHDLRIYGIEQTDLSEKYPIL